MTVKGCHVNEWRHIVKRKVNAAGQEKGKEGKVILKRTVLVQLGGGIKEGKERMNKQTRATNHRPIIIRRRGSGGQQQRLLRQSPSFLLPPQILLSSGPQCSTIPIRQLLPDEKGPSVDHQGAIHYRMMHLFFRLMTGGSSAATIASSKTFFNPF